MALREKSWFKNIAAISSADGERNLAPAQSGLFAPLAASTSARQSESTRLRQLRQTDRPTGLLNELDRRPSNRATNRPAVGRSSGQTLRQTAQSEMWSVWPNELVDAQPTLYRQQADFPSEPSIWTLGCHGRANCLNLLGFQRSHTNTVIILSRRFYFRLSSCLVLEV